MLVFLIIDTFGLLSIAEKLLWSLAIVSTVLLGMLIISSFFDEDQDKERAPSSRSRLPDSRALLLFFTFLSWTSILAHSWEENLLISALYGLPLALLSAFIPTFLSRNRHRLRREKGAENFPLEKTLTSTGEVLQSIPSHSRGRGIVHLNLREAPYRLNAISRSGALPRGVPVRVVEVLDEHTIVVEPLEGRPPHLPSDS